ncbi:hypothetical protein PsorP6_013410 [Peronosclerospora sorghi]|uniref:Uncharacterized protein n=1 Tax=Peronosclerospora sorghi TaxID=230839 RepID=A0ACC0VFZ9_9STRA|nr:hypothetical protein PsorP6_013410 [Peronosclerospora sorghi]
MTLPNYEVSEEDAAMLAVERSPEIHDEDAADVQETSEEEMESPEEETPEKLETVPSAVEIGPQRTDLLQETEHLVTMNALLTQNLESAEAALSTKDAELEAPNQDFDLLKAQLADDQAKALEAILAAEILQEAVATDSAEAWAKLIKSHQSFTELAAATKES